MKNNAIHSTDWKGFPGFAVVVLISLCGTPLVLSQTITGVASGSVADPSGQAVAGAAVTLTNEDTRDARRTETDPTGSFVFPAVLPGKYTVTVEAKGFQTLQRTGNHLTANERLSFGKLQLAIGSVSESVTVSAQGVNVNTASSEGSALLTTRQLETLSNRSRDVVSLLNLLPGAETRDPVESIGNTSNESSPRVMGLQTGANTITVDGAPGTDVGGSGSFVIYTDFDSVSEVKVLLNNYQAEYGRQGGAMINIVTKSGTRDYHGTIYYYKRHEMFNASNYFNNATGLPKSIYRYQTEGATFGGPVSIPHVFNTRRERLFFFYALERNPGNTPASLSQFTMPTALERAGNFSQTFDQNNKLIVITDPSAHAPFSQNLIPSSRINSSGQAMLNIMPLPNQLNRAITSGVYNYQFALSTERAQLQNTFRIDYRATDKDSLFFRGSVWGNSTYGWNGSGGFPAWPLAKDFQEYLVHSGVLGYTRILSPHAVNELNATVRRDFLNHPLAPADELAKIQRSKIGFTAGQFHPEINPNDIIPNTSFGGVSNPPTFNSLGNGRYPGHRVNSVYTLSDGLTLTHGRHTLKFGAYFERNAVVEPSGSGITWAGSLAFAKDTNNPLDSNYAYSNAILGNFDTYSEPTARANPYGRANIFDWYVQDSWKVAPRLTLEIGLRVGWLNPQFLNPAGTTGAFALDRYQRSASPVYYQPTLVGNARMALNPLTGQTYPAALIGAYVPGTGSLSNGLVTSSDPNYPAGFIANPGELPQPRFGLAWDVFGNGKTALRLGFGKFYQIDRREPTASSPPVTYVPIVYYGNLGTFLNATGVLFPGSATGYEKNAPQPNDYHLTFGIQQKLRSSTVVEAKYVGTLGRNLNTSVNLNTLPYGVRFLPASVDKTTNKPLPDSFLMPYAGFGTITYNEYAATSNYHSLQLVGTRQFAHGLEFAAHWTWSKWMDYTGLPIYRPIRVWSYGKDSGDQTHVVVLTYTYAIPGASRVWSNKVTRMVLDNWQVSGVTTFASGMPSGVTFTTTDGADLTGGGDGQRVNVIANPNLSHGDRNVLHMLNTAAFARPGLNDPGNAPKDVFRLPGRNQWDATLFKNIPIGRESRVLQLRWEIYNVFNHTQFSAVNTTARFDASGNQINGQFGQATAARQPRLMQVAIRFRF